MSGVFDNPRSPFYRERREEPSWMDLLQVCMNGHKITAYGTSQPETLRKRCSECGAETITHCKKCNSPLPGYYHVPSVLSFHSEPPPKFCENCGEPFPWTGKENPDAADEDAASRPATEHVLPMDVVKGTRRYLEQIVTQANGCYENGWFDACSVMIRKLVEVLIIAVYEAKGESESIKSDGNFLMLNGLVDGILTQSAWNLGRETKTALPLLKALGDRAAHNRHYLARKQDVDKLIQGLRVSVEDFLYHAGLVK
jgi:hypothetical protein